MRGPTGRAAAPLTRRSAGNSVAGGPEARPRSARRKAKGEHPRSEPEAAEGATRARESGGRRRPARRARARPRARQQGPAVEEQGRAAAAAGARGGNPARPPGPRAYISSARKGTPREGRASGPGGPTRGRQHTLPDRSAVSATGWRMQRAAATRAQATWLRPMGRASMEP